MKTLKAVEKFKVVEYYNKKGQKRATLFDGDYVLDNYTIRSFDDLYDEVYEQENECAYVFGKVKTDEGIYALWGDSETLEKFITEISKH